MNRSKNAEKAPDNARFVLEQRREGGRLEIDPSWSEKEREARIDDVFSKDAFSGMEGVEIWIETEADEPMCLSCGCCVEDAKGILRGAAVEKGLQWGARMDYAGLKGYVARQRYLRAASKKPKEKRN